MSDVSVRDVARRAIAEVESGMFPPPFSFQRWGPQNQNGDDSSSILFDASGETVVYELPDEVGEFIATS